MKNESIRNRSVKISAETREIYEKRSREVEKDSTQDPDIPRLPIEKWELGEVGKFYRPLKTAVSVRIDNDVLAWLKSKGEGHLTRINEILRETMSADQKH
jgi:uncharacterized protein (DUF4415 family)